MNRLFVIMCAAVAAAIAIPADAAVEVFFLRHGETTWNRAKILQGTIAHTDLTDKGVRMAEATARGMAAAGIHFGRIYSSPLRRAMHTAEIIADCGAGPAPVADERLHEMCFGVYEGRRYEKGTFADDNLRRFFVEPDKYVPRGENAETFAQVGKRLRDFLDNEVRPLDGKVDRVLCVAHSLVLRALVRELAGDSAPASATKSLQRNCCVHVVKFEDGRFSLGETGRIFYDIGDFDAISPPKMVAHRGAGDLTMPEASLPAYSNAVATACDIVKLDVQSTKDGVAVMGHDTTLKRNMGWDVRIADMTYAEIFEKGRFLENGRPGNLRIVRLDQALEIVRTLPEFWIDFKDGRDTFRPEFADMVLAQFSAAGIDLSRVMVATFNRKALKHMQEHHPEVRRVGHYEAAKDASPDDVLAAAISLAEKYGLYGLNMPVLFGQTTPQVVAELKKRGLWVSLWFVQDADKARLYHDSGADAFVTDHVTAVRTVARDFPVSAPSADVDATAIVQAALDECFKAGGGTVTLSAGEYNVGGLRLRSHTTLRLKSGAVLKGARDCERYRILSGDVLEPPRSGQDHVPQCDVQKCGSLSPLQLFRQRAVAAWNAAPRRVLRGRCRRGRETAAMRLWRKRCAVHADPEGCVHFLCWRAGGVHAGGVC